MNKTLQIIGPFASNYSFARVNRGLSKAMDEQNSEYEISLYQSKEKIDKWPDENDLKKFPYLKNLWRKESKETDVVIYLDYPKGGVVPHELDKIPAKTKIFYLPWEETVYPKIWVDEINKNMHGVMATAEYVRDILIKNGVKVPIEVVWNGIDEGMMIEPKDKYPLKTKKKFKFFHISSARKRKGIDVLLKAYFSEFSKSDDVCLVIKSFPGPDNQVEDLLRELQNENSPEVEHINNPDISDEDLVKLNKTCDCGVYPTRAEGFGLPILEGMYHSLPIIATNYSAYLDFANEENAYLVDYKLEKATDSEMVNLGAVWAEPDLIDLKEKMRFVFENRESDEVKRKIELAKKAAREITWENVSKKALEFVRKIESISDLKKKNAGVITFYNNEDGVADYSKSLYSKVENSFNEFYYISNKDIDSRTFLDDENVVRTWESGEKDFSETIDFIKKKNIEIIHIQYHSGINFPVEGLDNLIEKLKQVGTKVFITLHAVKGKGFNIADESKNLSLADKVFIHNEEDLTELNLKNAIHFRHPRSRYRNRSKNRLRKQLGIDSSYPIVSTHGKLVLEKIDVISTLNAVKELKKDYPDILYLVIDSVVSSNATANNDFERILNEAKKLGIEQNVIFIPDFINDDQVYSLLQASNIVLFPYKDVGESASSAISKSLAVNTPTIVTDIKMFSDFNEEVLKIENTDSKNIAAGVKLLLENEERMYEFVQAGKRYIDEFDYSGQGLRTLGEYVAG